jgi:hypothetical protein
MNGSKTVNPNTSAHLKILPRLGQMVWLIVRIPLLAFLVVLEPVVSFVLAGCALLGVLTTLFFRWTSVDPRFPFWTMLGISVGFAIALFLYEGLIHLLSRR